MDSNSNEPIKNNENLNAPLPQSPPQETQEVAPPPPQENNGGSQKKKSSKKSIAIKISLALLAIVFVLAGYAGVQMYEKMKEVKKVFDYIDEMSNYAAPTDLPIPKRGRVSSGRLNKRASRLFGSPGTVSHGNNSGMPTFSMDTESAKTFIENARKIDGEKIMKAMNKYAERSIVKEFMNDLRKDPSFQKALAGKDSHNPLEVMANINKIKNMKGLVGKYAMRPDFMKLMMDVMQDPEMRPLFKMMPGGMPSLSPSDIKNIQTEMEGEAKGLEKN